MVDYNQSLTVAEASRRLRLLDEEGLEWIEEPVRAHDLEGHARLARKLRTPLQCGEHWWGTGELRRALESQASELVMLDAAKVGGVTGWLRASALAGAPGSGIRWTPAAADRFAA